MIKISDSKSTSEIHATALVIDKCGVLIRGDSATGKTDLTLSLIKQGHQLIADDMVNLHLVKNKLEMTPKKLNQSIIHVRNLGFVDVAKIFGKKFLVKKYSLSLIIDLVKDNPHNAIEESFDFDIIHGVQVSRIKFEVDYKRPVSLLIELIVKEFKRRIKGKNSHQTFITRHTQRLRKKNATNNS